MGLQFGECGVLRNAGGTAPNALPNIIVAQNFANEKYAVSFAKPTIPRKNFLVVTCLDPRIQPYEQMGLQFGECGVLRNAGGTAPNALPNIIVAQNFGLRDIAIVHHTDCGLTHITHQLIRDAVQEANGAEAAKTVDQFDFHEFKDVPGSLIRDAVQEANGAEAAKTVDQFDFHEFKDVPGSVKRDVEYLARQSAIRKGTQITGWVYDVETGKVRCLERKFRFGSLVSKLSQVEDVVVS
uniref:Carbonic anhydrase n=1 Tax=Mycena chlorophos TaxID=658473 RepID=A0ABQ0LW84_MYCCL|nr:carbonic anhydrase [Mycena chlorophos]